MLRPPLPVSSTHIDVYTSRTRKNKEEKDENDNCVKKESLIVSYEKTEDRKRKKDISSDVFHRIS
jgi:hypothetical protein